MHQFALRSQEKELLDQEYIPQKDLFLNLSELHTINSLLGGYKVSLYGIKKLLSVHQSPSVKLLDIGSGGGDTLRSIAKHVDAQKVDLVGVDLKEDCVKYAENGDNPKNIRFIQSDYKDLLHSDHQFDIVTNALFCHHLSEDELVELIQWMYQNAKIGFVINDLHRHFLAYYSIKWLTQLFSKSYLVKNDAPLSVKRGFVKEDWERILKKAGVKTYQIKWVWAFRWCIIVQKNDCMNG